jgi:hypothetical protein
VVLLGGGSGPPPPGPSSLSAMRSSWLVSHGKPFTQPLTMATGIGAGLDARLVCWVRLGLD